MSTISRAHAADELEALTIEGAATLSVTNTNARHGQPALGLLTRDPATSTRTDLLARTGTAVATTVATTVVPRRSRRDRPWRHPPRSRRHRA